MQNYCAAAGSCLNHPGWSLFQSGRICVGVGPDRWVMSAMLHPSTSVFLIFAWFESGMMVVACVQKVASFGKARYQYCFCG